MIESGFRETQLAEEARYQLTDAQYLRRRPLESPDAPELAKWRDTALELDERVPALITQVRRSLPLRWVRCIDGSRHLHIRDAGLQHTLSFEPQLEGIVDTYVRWSSPRPAMRVDLVRVEVGITPAAVVERVNGIVSGWIAQRALAHLWLRAFVERSADLCDTYAHEHDLVAAAAALAQAAAEFGAKPQHERRWVDREVAPLLKLAQWAQQPWAVAVRDGAQRLGSQLVRIHDQASDVPNPYRGLLL